MLFRNLLIGLCFMFATTLAMASDSERHQVVDGMSIYLGIIPAQFVKDHSGMHGGAGDKKHNYHVLVALFDSKSGERITDANVKATVSPLGMAGSTKHMEAMHGDIVSYGNFFSMQKPETYRILVEVQRGKSGGKSVANFIHRRSKD